MAAWLADAANAARFAGHAADLVVTVAEALRDEDVQRVLTAELIRAVDAVEVAPLAGRAVRVMIAGGHHAELFNAMVSAADRYLAEHHEELRERFEAEAPRWVPDVVYGRVFDRLYARLRERLEAMANDPDDETRQQFEDVDRRASRPPGDLPGAARARGAPQARRAGQRRAAGLVLVAVEEGQGDAADPGRRPGVRAAPPAGRRAGGGRPAPRLRPPLQDGLERMVESGARALADQFHDELAGLVTGTIERWDAAETSTQLELLLGRDLQFIRINGTVVGAGVGLALHAIVLGLA